MMTLSDKSVIPLMIWTVPCNRDRNGLKCALTRVLVSLWCDTRVSRIDMSDQWSPTRLLGAGGGAKPERSSGKANPGRSRDYYRAAPGCRFARLRDRWTGWGLATGWRRERLVEFSLATQSTATHDTLCQLLGEDPRRTASDPPSRLRIRRRDPLRRPRGPPRSSLATPNVSSYAGLRKIEAFLEVPSEPARNQP